MEASTFRLLPCVFGTVVAAASVPGASVDSLPWLIGTEPTLILLVPNAFSATANQRLSHEKGPSLQEPGPKTSWTILNS